MTLTLKIENLDQVDAAEFIRAIGRAVDRIRREQAASQINFPEPKLYFSYENNERK